MPTELYGIARSIVLDTDSKGTALIAEAFPTQYKVYVILKSPKHKQYLPSKYYDREDDESDLVIDMNTVNGNITLKMNNK